ncbi:hypothetical protein [Arthrobacter sp. SDTb3-6]|uniref:hypothetical protein n=1 Tax=Arthrobacter sp. SDTb3-6 TaxID=2713571 RepID=UPI00159D87AD|nr:hypothetical protein [Arthrobacter sp. SDTb3-6]NVN00047.1 hypothetical protein [Arthrobacter sp. SDTb3-6]
MDYVPAAMLWLLTLIRIPTARDRERASVLRATFFAAVACTLFIPAVYIAADPLLGGHNHVGLLLITAILAGFWQFHTATVLAAITNNARRRRHLGRGRLAAAVAGACVIAGFAASRVDATNQNLPLAYGNQPGMQLFLWAGSAFIIWVCADVALTCLKFLPRMRSRTFKSGVGAFAAGCTLMALALGNRLALGLLEESPARNSTVLGGLNWSFTILETLAVLLVSIGLMLPRFRESPGLLRRNLRSRWLMALLTPAWWRSSTERKYRLRNRWTPILDPVTGQATAHLHRRVIEIRDCQLRGLTLLPRDRVLISQAEQLLQGR